jgi:hypothetical protein
VAFTHSSGGVFTEYAAPKSAATWFYGRNGSGTNAGFYQDSAYPGHIHGFLLEASTFTVFNHPNAANTWLFNVNLLGSAVGSFKRRRVPDQGIQAGERQVHHDWLSQCAGNLCPGDQ